MTKNSEFVNKLVVTESDDAKLDGKKISVKKNAFMEDKTLFINKESELENVEKSEMKQQKELKRSESKKDMSDKDTKNSKGHSSRTISDSRPLKSSEVKSKEKSLKKTDRAMRRLRGSVHTIQALSKLSRCYVYKFV